MMRAEFDSKDLLRRRWPLPTVYETLTPDVHNFVCTVAIVASLSSRRLMALHRAPPLFTGLFDGHLRALNAWCTLVHFDCVYPPVPSKNTTIFEVSLRFRTAYQPICLEDSHSMRHIPSFRRFPSSVPCHHRLISSYILHWSTCT